MSNLSNQSRKSPLLYFTSISALTGLFSLAIALPDSARALLAIRQTIDPADQETRLTPLVAQASEKVRIAVLDFDFSSVSNPTYLTLFPGGSKGVSDILVNKLVKDGNYVVIERSQIEAILREQDFGASGRVDASTAAQIGRILGVQAVIIGSVTQFDLEEKKEGTSVLGLFGNSSTDTNAYVKLSARVVNTNTAEIMMVADGNGTANQSDSQTTVLGIGGGSSTSNQGKLLTLATEQAIDQVVASLHNDSAQFSSLPQALPNVSAVIADVTGNTVIINKGKSDGYRLGLRLSIERVTKKVKDPQTGQVIRTVTQPIGLVELTEVDSTSSVGRVISGTKFKVGDLAKPSQ
jgi:curli biogenesis system outer membrane secretion channel CsgG